MGKYDLLWHHSLNGDLMEALHFASSNLGFSPFYEWAKAAKEDHWSAIYYRDGLHAGWANLAVVHWLGVNLRSRVN